MTTHLDVAASRRSSGPAAQTAEHGGDLTAIRTRYPRAPLPWLDLSTGINPWPYPIGRVPSAAWRPLPDGHAMADLRAAAAAHFGVDARTVVAAPGSQSIIQWLPTLRAPGHVAVVSPTYTEHAACWRRAGHRVSAIAAPGEIPRDATAVVVTRPNNPDGRVVPFEWLAATATALARRGGLLVIDEAFADVEAAPSDSARLPPATTISLRSFGKFFGLAGARLGFALADGETGDRLRAALGPWPVAGPTIAVATRAYRDTDWIARTRRRLEHAANALDTLAGRSGLALVGGTSLYRLYRHGRARAVFERLAAAGIYVRRFTDQPDWLRIGLPPDAPARRRLERALGL